MSGTRVPVLHAESFGSGPRLVLLHGFAQTARSWIDIASDLARDHEVVCVDAPGHGSSGHEAVDLEGAAELLVATGGPATYIGYSMGGRIALHAALAHPDRVHRLVLLGATPGLTGDDERAARVAADETLARRLETEGLEAFLDHWLALPLFSGLDERTRQRTDRRRNSAERLASSLRACGTGAQRDLRGELGRLSMPTLLLAGAHDTKFARVAAEMYRLIGPTSEIHLVPGAGHSAHLEAPSEFLRILRQWLVTHPDPANA